MGATDTFYDLAQGLEGNVKRATKEMGNFNDVSQKINNSFVKTTKEIKITEDVSKKVNDTYDDINKTSKEIKDKSTAWNSALNSVKSSAKNIIGIFAAGAGALSFFDAIKGAINLHQNMMDLSYQMGHGAKGAKYLENSIMDITASTGMALEEVQRMTSALVQLKVPIGMVKQLTIDSTRFSEITGANADSVAQMTAGLVVMGGLGQKSISSIMGDMVQVQRAFGISAGEVDKLTNNITDTTMILRNMGKNANEIEKFQKGTMKLAGAFASVGIKAGEATDLIDRLLDPSKLEQNALLYSKLGISIEDAISGNIDPAEMARGLQGLGSELKDMAGPQAAALANALGIPLNQLRQMGNMDMKQIQETFGALTGSSETLSAAQKDQATAQRNMAQMWEKVKGVIGEIALKLMPIFDAVAAALNDNMGNILGWVKGIINSGFVDKFINKIAIGIKNVGGVLSSITSGIGKIFSNLNPKILLIGLVALIGGMILFKRKFASVATDSSKEIVKSFRGYSKEIGKEIADGISGGLEMASEKGSRIFAATMKVSTRATADDINTKITAGHQSAALSAAANYQKILSEQNTFGWAKKMNKSTSEWLETISAGGKPLSKFDSYYQNAQNALREKMEMSKVDYKLESEHLTGVEKEQEQQISQLNNRKNILEGLAKTGKITAEQSWELGKIDKEINKTEKEHAKIQQEINNLQKNSNQATNDYINKLGPDELALYKQQLETKKSSIESDKAILLTNINKLKTDQEILTAANLSLETKRKELEASIKSGDASFEEMENYKKINKALDENKKANDDINSALIEAGESEKQFNKDLQSTNKDLEKAVESSNKIGPGDPDRMFKSFGKNLGDAATGAMGIIGSKFTDVREKLSKSFHDAGKALKESVKPSNWIAAVRKAGDGNLFRGFLKVGGDVAKNIGGALGKAGKAIGGVISGAGKALSSAGKLAGGLAMAGGGLLLGAFMKSEKGQEAMAKIQEKIGEVMSKLAPVFSNLLESLGPLFDSLMNIIGPIIDQVAGFLVGLAQNLVPMIMGMVEKLLPIIMGLVEKLLPVIMGLLEKMLPFIMGLIESLMPIFEVLMDVVVNLVSSLLPALMPLIMTMIDLFVPLIKMLLPPLLKVLGFLLVVLGTIITVIGQVISGLGSFIPGLKGVGDSIQGVGKGMKESGVSVANSMNKASEKIGDYTQAMKDLKLESLKTNVKGLTQTLGITAQETLTMSHKELVTEINSNGKREALIQQMMENTKALAQQYTQLEARNAAELASIELEKAREQAKRTTLDSAQLGSVFKFGGGRQGLGRELTKSGREFDFYEALKKTGGILTETTALLFKNQLIAAGGVFNDVFDSSGKIISDKLVKANEALEEGDTLGRMENYIRTASVTVDDTLKKQIANALSGDQKAAFAGMTNAQLQEIIDQSGGETDKIVGAITAALSKQGGVLQQAGMKRSVGELLEESLLGLTDARTAIDKRGGKTTEDTQQRAELQDLINKVTKIKTDTTYRTEEERLAALEKAMQGSSSLVAASLAGQVKTLELIEESVEDTVGAIKHLDESPSSSEQTETVTKLYPAIIEASASGFVKTQEAESRTTGGTPQERTAASAEQQVIALEGMIAGQGEQTETTKLLLTEIRRLRELQEAAGVVGK